MELAKLLCRKGGLELGKGERSAALAALREAEARTEGLHVTVDSELGMAISGLREQLC